MSRNLINLVVFLAGLAAVCWIGAGYIGSNLLALAVTLLIAACYVAGALELKRYNEATSGLTRAIDGLSAPPASLGAWLEQLPASLRNAARLRVEGERVALPGPALAPYLVGLLVLLGMLGTLLGMVATLRGTGMALDSATDLQAIRASLAAPVKGLGFAFGTSIAGVATSAMLGLLSALCRRERIQAAHMLDVKIATTLRIYSQTHQREEAFRLLQRQAEVMPALVDRLQAMMTAIEQQNHVLNERQVANQDAFHGRTEATYTRLAASVERSMKESVAESARAAGAALQPVMEATMAVLTRESAALHTSVTTAVQRQLDGLSSGFESTATNVSDIWHQALTAHQHSTEGLSEHLRLSLDRFNETFEQRSISLLDGVSTRLDATTAGISAAWRDALAQQERIGEKLAQHNAHALNAAAASFEQHSASLLGKVDQSHSNLQTELASRDEARLAAWTGQLESISTTLSREWEQAGARTATRQQDICDTLASTARDISAQTQAHASDTIGEISRLVQAASEAPKAAAEMIAELRIKLSDSMVRDTAMLEERSRLLATLETLLDAVNHASTEQRTAVDALVSTSADLLDRVGTRFTDKVEQETGKLSGIAAQVTGSAVEVASLGEAFGVAVQLFGDSNEKLVAHLQRIEIALDKSLTRSDEQLAYYVAQAREVIDLSVMSQKQIIEDLQQIGGKRTSAGAETA
ncbi:MULTISPECIES: DUF802 domain-containing protein [Burkholderiaceae]|uniref:Methyl-accepting chemotaxis protein n=1 Tax=Caballeronia sordidicola TaxID=196367 RepID=A0A242MIW2_CABSO|nr:MULTISPECIES: DUF802 domain-containing protein [Burkholderiaceae]AMH43342.1 hypothetical protein AXG89_37090 [Burkholderia sp. PAMC 26561]OTP71246.1 Methyl-accepting chemotaxis protein [Caballeronia sordidicola]